MKSIVLCENTLIKQKGDTKNLKDEHVEEEVKLNGATEDKKSDSQVPDRTSQENENFLHNGNNGTTEDPPIIEVSENGEEKATKDADNSEREKCTPSDGKSMAVTVGTDLSSNDKSENRVKSRKNSSDVSETSNENSNAPNSSEKESDLKKKKININDNSFNDVCNDVSEVTILDDEETVTGEVAPNSSLKDEGSRYLSDTIPEIKVEESEQPSIEEIFDVDSNKENVKDDKTNSAEDLSKDSEEEGHCCEIQVEKVQSVSSQDLSFNWLSSDSEKSHQDAGESAQKETEESEDVSSCNEELQKISEEEKEMPCEVIDSAGSKQTDNEDLDMEVEEADEGVEINEENKREFTEWDEGTGEGDTKTAEKVEPGTVSKKRPITDDKEEDTSAKKIKLSENQTDCSDEMKVDSPAAVDTEGDSKAGEGSLEGEAAEEKVTDEEKMENGEDAGKEGESEKDSSAPSSSFLASFRGTLKTLTRSDLEELIVQKLCEVITERSTVGDLRRKAQALEQDQERWKQKVQTLTKQMKEMEMVMKKYMSEVQKQLKEGANYVATPIRVTRSVGLQVSFLAHPSKGSKPNVSPPSTPSPAQTVNTRNSRGSPKPSPQFTPVSQNLRSKSMPVTAKNSPTPPKAPVIQQRRQSAAPNTTPANRTVATAVIPIVNRTFQTQVQGPRPVYKPVTSTAQLQQQQQQQQQIQQQSQQVQQQQLQQQQHGSKVIDLTEDDDQKTNNTGKPNTPARVVSHMPQVQAGTPPNSRYAYLVPATSTSAGLGGTQNRQVLIATPAISAPQQNRQIMCSMPPLLFKGGNQIQPTPQAQAVNQNNSRVIFPKVLRHPAPLPQAPIRNWGNMKQLPPRPALKISKVQTGIVLSWNMALGPEHAPIRSYQLYAYQESNSPPMTSLWKKVGDVKALPLPMACTLTQFVSGHKYHFAVRAVDLHSRIGPFSFPGTIVLVHGVLPELKSSPNPPLKDDTRQWVCHPLQRWWRPGAMHWRGKNGGSFEIGALLTSPTPRP